jgi:hypothetical protein
VPTGIVTDDSTKIFFNELISSRNLCGLAGFYEIRPWFKGTDNRKSFCLFTIGSTDHPRFIFDLINAGELLNKPRRLFKAETSFATSLTRPMSWG